MKKITTWMLLCILTLAIVWSSVEVSEAAVERPTQVSALKKSGKCGKNVKWKIDSKGTLTVYGAGPMADYFWGEAPWYGNTKVKKVVIKKGVTTIGTTAFYGYCFRNLKSAVVASSVKRIGFNAFYGSGLKQITFQGNKPSLEQGNGNDSFARLKITGYYPKGNKTWKNVSKYWAGGIFTWKAK